VKLDPSQIHQVVKQATQGQKAESKSSDFKDLLERNGLSEEEVLESIGSVMRGGETDQVRLRAAELGAKLHGFMQPEGLNVPNITIVIKDAQPGSMNSILIPR
jgi:hypothetical protein